MNIFKRLRDYFSRKKIKAKDNNEKLLKEHEVPQEGEEDFEECLDPEDSINSQVIFDLDVSGGVSVYFNIQSVNEVSAKQIGMFLCYLNNGDLAPQILNNVVQLSQQNIYMSAYASAIIDEWKKQDAKRNQEPVISPLEVFKRSNSLGDD